MKLHLFLQYYVPKDPVRAKEVDECLHRNFSNPVIDRVVVFLESKKDVKRIPVNAKVSTVGLTRRVTYRDWLEAVNETRPGEISVLINADIYLDDTVRLLKERTHDLKAQKVFTVLTRYNRRPTGLALNSSPHWCQDTWAVVRDDAPFPSGLLQEAAFELGHPGCDNKIAYVMHSYGYRLSNPCLPVRTVHLHADEKRSYDARESKLIGLHAFVHPVPHVAEQSKFEIELLSRNSQDIVDIHVNHWINGLTSYRLTGISPNDRAAQGGGEEQVAPASIEMKPLHKTDMEQGLDSLSGELRYIKTKNFNPDENELVKSFSSRFRLYSSPRHFAFFDAAWPAVAILPKESSPDLLSRSDLDQFLTGFVPSVLDIYPASVAAFPRHDRDNMFWQYPCRTEEDAWRNAKTTKDYIKEEKCQHIYVGLPWATFIDKGQFNRVIMLLIASKIRATRQFLNEVGISLKVHTVCQHIFWSKYIEEFQRLGISDLWVSHKERGQKALSQISIHAWPLYAVNFREANRQDGLSIKSVSERDVFASFVGAHMAHYLSDIRLKLKELSVLPGYQVELTNEWHFNRLVYEYQVKGVTPEAGAIDQSAIANYNRSLSNSIFSLCPAGAGPNTLRLWESLAAGAIPVSLSDKLQLPDIEKLAPGCGLKWEDAVIFHSESDISTLDERLRGISNTELGTMQKAGRLIHMLFERHSPVNAPLALNLLPLDMLAQVKPQQLQIQGLVKAQLDGEAFEYPLRLPIEGDCSEAIIRFDKTERLFGVMLEIEWTGAEDLHIDVLAAAFDDRFKLLGTLSSKHGRFQTLLPRQGGMDWATALKIVVSRSTANGLSAAVILAPVLTKNAFAREVIELDKMGAIAAASEENENRNDDLFDTESIESGRIISMLSKIRVSDNPKRLFPELPARKFNLIGEVVSTGITMFVHLMNRNENIKRNLSNWLSQGVDELILLDWSSTSPVAEIPLIFSDLRVRVVRVEGESSFIRSWAQNLAIKMARFNKIFKCDSDVSFRGDFFTRHPLEPGDFWVGDWQHARDLNERHLHGETYFHVDDFMRVNGYDERILYYGHDDTNLKDRMLLAGLVKRVMSYDHLFHEPHDNAIRGAHQQIDHPLVNTRYNRLLANCRKIWSPSMEGTEYYLVPSKNKRYIRLRIAKRCELMEDAKLKEMALNTVAKWYIPGGVMDALSREEKLKIIWERSKE